MENNELKSFMEYCEANPEMRFWQALRSWSGADFILKAHLTSKDGGEKVVFDQMPVYLKDTFNE